MSSFSDVEALRRDVRIGKEYLIVFVSILLWDTVATWPSEYRYMWKQARWSPMRALFFINRYWTILMQITLLVTVLVKIPADTCEKMFWLQALGAISIMFLCGMIASLRIYTIYEHNRAIMFTLVGMLAVELAVMIGAATQLTGLSAPTKTADYIGFIGCTVQPRSLAPRVVVALFWTPSLIFHIVALGLVLYKDFVLYRPTGNKVPITRRLVAHGVFYLTVMIASNLPNLFLCLQSRPTFLLMNSVATLTITSLMASRLIISYFNPTNAATNSVVSPVALVPSSGGGGPTVNSVSISHSTQPYSITLNNEQSDSIDKVERDRHDSNVLDLEDGKPETKEGKTSEDGEELLVESFAPVLARTTTRLEPEIEEKSSV
ncbi:hypothetical protein JCM10212_004078 [Sporobolomyces blumeae]